MPTIITHALVPAAIAVGLGQRVIPARLAAAGAIAAMVPDVDVLGLKLGIPHGSDFGHRGFTHSLAFAAALAFAGGSWRGWLFLFLAVTSHGMLDAFTNGGAGIEFFWPFSDQRHFAPWRPIEVSPPRHPRLLQRSRCRGPEIRSNLGLVTDARPGARALCRPAAPMNTRGDTTWML